MARNKDLTMKQQVELRVAHRIAPLLIARYDTGITTEGLRHYLLVTGTATQRQDLTILGIGQDCKRCANAKMGEFLRFFRDDSGSRFFQFVPRMNQKERGKLEKNGQPIPVNGGWIYADGIGWLASTGRMSWDDASAYLNRIELWLTKHAHGVMATVEAVHAVKEMVDAHAAFARPALLGSDFQPELLSA